MSRGKEEHGGVIYKGTDKNTWMSWLIKVRVAENTPLPLHTAWTPRGPLGGTRATEAAAVFLEATGPLVRELICFFNAQNVLKGHLASRRSFTCPPQPWRGGRL